MTASITARAPRLPDWPDRLAAFFAERQAMPFAWGTNDCCQFAAAAIEAMTGVPPAPHTVGQYSDVYGAREYAQDPAPGDPLGVLDWPLAIGLAPVSVHLAQRGDIVALHANGSRFVSLAVSYGSYALAAGKTGTVLVPLGGWLAAWRV